MLGVIGVILLLLHRHRAARLWLLLSVLAGYLCSIPLTANILSALYQHNAPIPAAILADPPPATAIVILTGGLNTIAPEYPSTTVSLLTLGRLRYGAVIARQTGLPLLISGGLKHPHRPRDQELAEAEIAAKIMRDEFNVEVSWIEPGSRNTWQNVTNSSKLLHAHQIKTVVLVTHAAHIARAADSF